MDRASFSDVVHMAVGRFRLDVFRHGSLVERIDEPNIIVNGAAAIMAGLLGGVASPITQIGFGTSLAPPALGNSVLSGAFTKAVDGVTYPTPGVAQFAFSLASNQANGVAIGEFGLLTAAGVLFARKARTASNPIPKDITISLAGTWSIRFASSAA